MPLKNVALNPSSCFLRELTWCFLSTVRLLCARACVCEASNDSDLWANSVWETDTLSQLWHPITLMWKTGICGSCGSERRPHTDTDHWHASARWYLTDPIMWSRLCWHLDVLCSGWLSLSRAPPFLSGCSGSRRTIRRCWRLSLCVVAAQTAIDSQAAERPFMRPTFQTSSILTESQIVKHNLMAKVILGFLVFYYPISPSICSKLCEWMSNEAQLRRYPSNPHCSWSASFHPWIPSQPRCEPPYDRALAQY